MAARRAEAPRDDARTLARRIAARSAGRHPAPLSEGRSRNMQAIRRAGTKPELSLRSALHRRGLRYRVDMLIRFDGGKVRPDVVFTRLRLAVFVDGCFWHACPEHGRRPTVNGSYWSPKLARTVERDRKADALLASEGWTVVRVWEHEALDEAVARVEHAAVMRRHEVEHQSSL